MGTAHKLARLWCPPAKLRNRRDILATPSTSPISPYRISVDAVRSRTARVEDEWFALLDEMGREQAFASRNRPAGLPETEELTARLGLSALRALPVFFRVWTLKST